MMVAGVIFYAILSALGVLTLRILTLVLPLCAWTLRVLAIAWLASVLGLLVLHASHTYMLRYSSVEIDEGIATSKSLVVSPSAFSELEVDQGVFGRMLSRGSLEVHSQGGQQLNLRLMRDPDSVSARKIREVMSTPTPRIAGHEEPPGPQRTRVFCRNPGWLVCLESRPWSFLISSRGDGQASEFSVRELGEFAPKLVHHAMQRRRFLLHGIGACNQG